MIQFVTLSNHFFPSCSSVSIQLQLHANKSPVLQRRKGGTPNWIDCKSVHQAGSESIMQRNDFWKTECPHWVRGAFCLQQPGPALFAFYDKLITKHCAQCSIADIVSCDVHCAALQNISRLFAFSSAIGWLECFFHWLHICVPIFV